VDEEVVFYMMTRGISRQDAVRILVEGYFEPVIGRLEDEHLAELVRERIAGKIAAAEEHVEGIQSPPALMATAPPKPPSRTSRSEFPVLRREVEMGQARDVRGLPRRASQEARAGAGDDGPLPWRESNASVHRGLYDLGREGHRHVRGARAGAHRALSWAATPRTHDLPPHNATEAINLVAYAWAPRQPRSGR